MNNWYVITGAPSSGKTTTLTELEKRGFKVVPEAARTHIDQELAKGKTLTDIRKNEVTFQKKVLQMKLTNEKKQSPDARVFFDRGIHDSLAYLWQVNHPITPQLHQAVQTTRYAKVFLLEMLEFEPDYARTEDLKTAQELEKLLKKAYLEYLMRVITVPWMTLEERVEYILKHIDTPHD